MTTVDTGACIDPPPSASVSYEVGTVPSGTPRAAGAADFIPESGFHPGLYDHRGNPQFAEEMVSIIDDAGLEPVVELAEARITATSGRPDEPQNAPIYVIDDDVLDNRVSFEETRAV